LLSREQLKHPIDPMQDPFRYVALPKDFIFFWFSNARECHSAPRHQVTVLQMCKVSDTVRSTHGQDGAVVLDIRRGQMFNVNLVGSRILALLKGGSAQAEIVDEIVREFGVSRDRAESDVQEFLETLKKNHLVESTTERSQE
jgi:hypothetical protein